MQPTAADLMRVTREKLNIIAEARGIDPTPYATKRELVDVLINGADASDSAAERANVSHASHESDAGEQRVTGDSEALIDVTGAGARNRVALWERHAQHPNGEIFLVGGQRARVYPTRAVLDAIRDGRLERN